MKIDYARNPPEVGDMWKEVDPRFERFIKVREVIGDKVTISRCERNGEVWNSLRVTKASIGRFNGKRGGYELVYR